MHFFLGFMGGVSFGSFLRISTLVLLICFFVGLFLSIFRKWQKVFWIGIFVASLSFGAFYYQYYVESHADRVFIKKIGSTITEKGIISDEPDKRENATRLKVKVGAVVFLVTTDPHSTIKYGDEILFSGTLEKPENFNATPTKVFDYVHFLEKDQIFYLVKKPKIELIAEHKGSWLYHSLISIKQAFLSSLAKVIPEPELSLLGGILLGTKQALGKELQSDFQRTGVIHMVVVSGYNITIVAEAIGAFFSFLGLYLRLAFSFIGIVLFVMMTGGSSAVVRAGIMTSVALLGKSLGRQYSVVRALIFAAFLMVLHNPMILMFDPSFQLSFMATLALILVSPVIEPYFQWITEKGALRATIVASLSTQIFLLPLLLYMTGLFSVVSLPVNVLVLFPIPLTMLTGFISGLLGFVDSGVALPTGFVTTMILSYVLWVVKTAANFQFAAVSIDSFPLWCTIIIYLFYTIILWRFHRRNAQIGKEC